MSKAGLMVTVKSEVPESLLALVACTVKVNVPTVVGVPLTVPALIPTPGGREPRLMDHVHVHGLPPSVALRLPEYGAPTSPVPGREPLTTTCPAAVAANTSIRTSAPAKLCNRNLSLRLIMATG